MAINLVRRISISYGLLLFIALGCAAAAVWASFAAQYHLNRADLAHRAYEAHLKISVDTTKLFKELQKGLLFEGAAQPEVQEALMKSIAQDIASIRTVITDEIVLVGEEEVEELETLDRLRERIDETILHYEKVSAEEDRIALISDPAALAAFVNHPSKQAVYDEIQIALDEEIGEVIETHEEALGMATITRLLAVIFGGLAAAIAGISVLMLTRDITQPLQEIVTGARKFAAGDYEHNIDKSIGGSLGQVANAINDAAAIAKERQETLEDAKVRLEHEVALQTAELRRTILTLEEQKKTRQRFLADVSHELRTPLTVIQGEVDIALRGGDKDPQTYKEALQRASDAAKHTAQLVNDVLFIGRQESDQAKLQLKREDLVDLVRSVLHTTLSMQQEHNVDVDFIPETESAIAPVDVDRIRQVLMILLENACHYGGDKITIRLMSSIEGFALIFKDNGPGISAEDLEQVFTRYFRGSNAAERYEAGAGLGLPVAKSIIDAHKGKIDVTSTPGDGVEFRILLPAKNTLRAVS